MGNAAPREQSMVINRAALVERIDARMSELNRQFEVALENGLAIKAGQVKKASEELQGVIDAIGEIE